MIVVNTADWRRDNEHKRLDSNYQMPIYKKVIAKLKAFGAQQLHEDQPEIIHPVEIKRNYVDSDAGIWFLRAQNVRPLVVEEDANKVKISEKDAEILSGNTIRRGDVLVTRSGANRGQCALYDVAENAIASSHTFIIRPNKINPAHLAVFLNTKYGTEQIDRGVYGSVQPEIAPYYLLNIWIPLISPELTKRISDLMRDAQEARDLAIAMYKEIENQFMVAINFDCRQSVPEVGTYEVMSENVRLAERLDAGYFQPRHEEIVDIIKKLDGGALPLGDLVTVNEGIEVGAAEYLDEGVPFTRVGDLSPFGLSEGKYISIDLYEKIKEFQPMRNDILLSKDGSIGIAYHIMEEPIPMVHSKGVLRLSVDSEVVLPEYLCLALNSFAVREQAIRDSGGTVLQHWRTDQVVSIQIPILPMKDQQAIREKISTSFMWRKRSRDLCRRAVDAMTIAIENGEGQSEQYLSEHHR